VEEYYTRLMDKYPDGKMDIPDFKGRWYRKSIKLLNLSLKIQ
jgi:hypothetical protein